MILFILSNVTRIILLKSGFGTPELLADSILTGASILS